MAYDNTLAAALRESLRGTQGVSEKRMFGGLCFLLNGNMLCTTRGEGGMYRVGPERMETALALPGATPTIMRGRPMNGFVTVGRHSIEDLEQRRALLGMALEFVSNLPMK